MSSTPAAMQAPRLVSVCGATTGDTLEIPSEKFSIGRALQNSYVIEDVLISRHHCSIELIDGCWTILDTSINGTHLNNVLIGKNNRKNLDYGDIITLTNDLKYKFEPKEVLPEDDEFIAVAEAVMDSVDMAEAIVQPVAVAEALEAEKSEPKSSSFKVEEDELTCSVCTELFIEAVTLGCSHTFCKYCIEQWRKNADLCPICRTKIKGLFPTLVINNLVEKYLPETSEEDRTRRKQIIEERRNAQTPASAAATKPAPSTSDPIEIFSEDEDYDDAEGEDDGEDDFYDDGVTFSDYDWHDEYDNDEYYNGLPGAYYGGYGVCYSCGDRGHWANGCPLNPRRRGN